MDYKGFTKSLQLPAGYAPPIELVYEDIVARALGRADLVADTKGVDSREIPPMRSLDSVMGL